MKREGRQHGMVRTYRVLPAPLNPRPGTRQINMFDSPPTAGLFTKVPTKPTNHSKFTGKCAKPRCTGCHIHPACKAKDKTKGNQKLNSADVASNYRLVTWRVVDGRPGLNFSGSSATGILDHLSSDYDNNYDDDHDEEEANGHANDTYEYDDRHVDSHGYNRNDDLRVDFDKVDGHGNNEEMGFFNVDYVIDEIDQEDEGWCLVPET